MWRASLLCLLLLLLTGCATGASGQPRPTVTPVTVPTAQLDPGVIVWPFPLTPGPSYPPPLAQAGSPPTLTAQATPQGLRVTWSAAEPVCPWLESGAVRLYAGGALPCRASGSALLSYVPDVGARVVLRRADGSEVAGVGVGWRVVLPWVVGR